MVPISWARALIQLEAHLGTRCLRSGSQILRARARLKIREVPGIPQSQLTFSQRLASRPELWADGRKVAGGG